MNALIIAAHGSRKKESAREVAALLKKVGEKAKKDFDFVEHAFLQFCDPLLGDMIETLVKKGVDHIIIFPFFIAAGSHILKDIPGLVEKKQERYKQVKFSITRHFGVIESIEDLILKEVSQYV